MVETKVKILAKIALDVLFAIIVLVTFFVAMFSYDSAKIYVTEGKNGVNGDRTRSFSDLKDKFCYNSTENPNEHYNADKCDLIEGWETAGITYMILAGLSIVFCAYGVARLGLRLVGKDFSFRVKYDLEYYIYSVLSFVAMILYIIISQVFSKDLEYGTETISSTPEAGLFLMIVAFVISLGSSIYFLLARKGLEQKSDLKKPLLNK